MTFVGTLITRFNDFRRACHLRHTCALWSSLQLGCRALARRGAGAQPECEPKPEPAAAAAAGGEHDVWPRAHRRQSDGDCDGDDSGYDTASAISEGSRRWNVYRARRDGIGARPRPASSINHFNDITYLQLKELDV